MMIKKEEGRERIFGMQPNSRIYFFAAINNFGWYIVILENIRTKRLRVFLGKDCEKMSEFDVLYVNIQKEKISIVSSEGEQIDITSSNHAAYGGVVMENIFHNRFFPASKKRIDTPATK